MRKTWVEMNNGERLTTIQFVAFIKSGEGREVGHQFGVANPPAYEGEPDLFKRLSFELLKERFAEWGYKVSYIIRGSSDEVSVRDCYVYDATHKVPFAIVRPLLFVRDA